MLQKQWRFVDRCLRRIRAKVPVYKIRVGREYRPRWMEYVGGLCRIVTGLADLVLAPFGYGCDLDVRWTQYMIEYSIGVSKAKREALEAQRAPFLAKLAEARATAAHKEWEEANRDRLPFTEPKEG